MISKITETGLRWSWLTIICLVLDQWTKQWAESALSNGQVIEVLPHFDFRLAYNYGAAFSFLGDQGGWQKWGLSIFAVVISIGLVVWLYRLTRQEPLLSVSISLILSGAIGNVIDRINYGYVIDFIDWYVSKNGYHWPTFNIADTAICIGAALLILDSFKNPKPSHPKDEKELKQSNAKS